MAEAWGWHLAGDSTEFASAGIYGGGSILPETVAVMAEVGLDLSGKVSKRVTDLDLASFDVAVSLCDVPAKSIVGPGFRGRTLDIPLPDPYGHGLDVYRDVRDKLRTLVLELLRDL
ncbi:MAG: hypothetical protein HRF45_07705 [Fimbriimonadia bacterium]|jgi:arsenate reductase